MGHVLADMPDAVLADMPNAAPPLIANLMQVAAQVKVRDIPVDELRNMQQVVQLEAVKVVQPRELLEVVRELNHDERETLAEALIEAKVVPEEQREMLEEAVRPGGYTDQLADAMSLVAMAHSYAWVAIALPGIEFILSLICGLLPCHVPLASWLRQDAILGLMTAGMARCAAHVLSPVSAQLQEDPMGMVQRLQVAGPSLSSLRRAASNMLSGSHGLEDQLQPMLGVAVPGIPLDVFRKAAICLAITAVLVVLGTLWAAIGLLEFLAAGVAGCAVAIRFFSFLFVGLRILGVLGLLFLVLHVVREVKKHRSSRAVIAIQMT